MILHPGILALLLGGCLVAGMMVFAGTLALQVARKWDLGSTSELQLQLERRTYLISTLVNYALGFQALSLILFVYTVDSLHPLFVGAMCATGSLNANPIGWTILEVKIAGFFLAGLWVVLNVYDQRAENYPLVRVKYLLLLPLLPLVLLDVIFQLDYFLGLHPEIITSCCGSMFSAGGGGVASTMASLPEIPMMWAYYGGALVLGAMALGCLLTSAPWLRWLLAISALMFLPLSLAAIVSFISVYIYELPTHHCPFDIVQQGYNFIGYPLYAAMFGTVFCGMIPAMLERMRKVHGLGTVLARSERYWLWGLLLALGLLLVLSTWPVVFGPFTLKGYV